MKKWKPVLVIVLLVAAAVYVGYLPASDAADNAQEWPAYGGGKDNSHPQGFTHIQVVFYLDIVIV